jgi:DNA repair protein RecO (recombination protein O)
MLTTRGIVLRVHRFSETSLIVRWLTEDFGRLSTLARGAKRPKSGFRGRLDLFGCNRFSFIHRKQSDLHLLKETENPEFFPALRKCYHRLEQASYAVHLLERNTEENTPVPELYTLFMDWLQRLNEIEESPEIVVLFELKFLHWLGLFPNLEQSNLSSPACYWMEQSLSTPLPEWIPNKWTSEVAVEVIRYLEEFMNHHLNKLPEDRVKALNAPAFDSGKWCS